MRVLGLPLSSMIRPDRHPAGARSPTSTTCAGRSRPGGANDRVPRPLAGYLVFGTYIVLNVVIGLWSGRQQKGADDLWTAGRRFGTVVMVLGPDVVDHARRLDPERRRVCGGVRRRRHPAAHQLCRGLPRHPAVLRAQAARHRRVHAVRLHGRSLRQRRSARLHRGRHRGVLHGLPRRADSRDGHRAQPDCSTCRSCRRWRSARCSSSSTSSSAAFSP